MTRKERALLIRKEVTKYLAAKKLSCHYEVGLNRWGKLRADVLAFDYAGQMIIIEVKSSKADFMTDDKWQNYLEFSTKTYFAFDSDFPLTAEIRKKIKEKGVGILVVNLDSNLKLFRSKSVKAVASAKLRTMDENSRLSIISRLAFRSGNLRTNKSKWMTK